MVITLVDELWGLSGIQRKGGLFPQLNWDSAPMMLPVESLRWSFEALTFLSERHGGFGGGHARRETRRGRDGRDDEDSTVMRSLRCDLCINV